MGFILKKHKETLQNSVFQYATAKPKEKQKQRIGSTKLALPFLLLINGASLGYLSGNRYLIPILGMGLCSLPFARKQKDISQGLKLALVTITNNYIAGRNLRDAVENCMASVPERYQPLFHQFLNIPLLEGITYLRSVLGMQYTKKWCDMLLLCHEDFSMHPLLLSVLQEQAELEITYFAYKQSRKRIRCIFKVFSIIFLLCWVCFLLFQKVQNLPMTELEKIIIALFFMNFFCCFHGIWAETKEV